MSTLILSVGHGASNGICFSLPPTQKPMLKMITVNYNIFSLCNETVALKVQLLTIEEHDCGLCPNGNHVSVELLLIFHDSFTLTVTEKVTIHSLP